MKSKLSIKQPSYFMKDQMVIFLLWHLDVNQEANTVTELSALSSPSEIYHYMLNTSYLYEVFIRAVYC